MTEKWRGTYKYSDKHARKIGDPEVRFEITIDSIDGHKFSGRIQDNLDDGGTRGVGIVKGSMENNKIQFVKQMPIATYTDGKNRTEIKGKKHPDIHYTGELKDGIYTGEWVIKPRLILFGLIPNFLMRTSGTWQMSIDRGTSHNNT